MVVRISIPLTLGSKAVISTKSTKRNKNKTDKILTGPLGFLA